MRLTLGVIGVLLSIVYLTIGMNYSVGALSRPGPGVFPMFIGILLFVSSIGICLGAKSKSASDGIEWPRGDGRGRILAIVAASVMYVVMLPYLGYLIVCAGITLVVLHVMGMHTWPRKIGVALITGIGSLWFFYVILGVQLPQGIIKIF